MANLKSKRKRKTRSEAEESDAGDGRPLEYPITSFYGVVQLGRRLQQERSTEKTSVSCGNPHTSSPELPLPHPAWDNEDIDHWKKVEIQPGEMAAPLLEESSFATLFPRYREKYLQQLWPHVTRALKDHVSTS